MIDPTRRELLKLLEELSEACPEYRLGQMILNLAFLAREDGDRSAWDLEDTELIEAAPSTWRTGTSTILHDRRSSRDRINGGRPSLADRRLEPRDRRAADRVRGLVAEHQAVPGQGLVDAAHPLAQVGDAMVQVGMRGEAQRLVGVGLPIDRQGPIPRGDRVADPGVERLGLPDGPATRSTRLSR